LLKRSVFLIGLRLFCHPNTSLQEISLKKRWIPVGVLVLLFLGSLALGADQPWEMRLPFKDATIHYELKGSEQGVETLYIRDYGKVRARHHKVTAIIMGMTQKNDTLELTDSDWITTYNLIEKNGEKVSNPQKLFRTEYSKFNSEEKKNFEENSKELGVSMMGNFGGAVKQNSAKLLGFDCDVTTVGGISTVYLLHGTDIPLKSEVAVMGMASTVAATKIDTSTAVPDAAFLPPAGITAQLNAESETIMADTIQNVMDTLKPPDGAKAMQSFGQNMMPTGAVQPGMGGGGSADQAEQQQMIRDTEAAMNKMNQKKPQ